MNRILSTLAAFLLAPLVVSQAAETKRPNILIVINDDQSWLECSAYGNSSVQTPAFDRVAKAGVLFTRGYCSAPSCAPARAALLTGRNFWELEQGAFIQAWLPAKFAPLPERLAAAGYHTGYTGKGWGPGVKEPTGQRADPMGKAWNSVRIKSPPEGISNVDYTVNGLEWHGNLPPIDIAARMIRDERFQYIVNYSRTPRGGTNERARQPDDRYAANAAKLDVLPLLAAHPERPELQRFIQFIKAPRPREELYDCVADPDQLQNLADKPEFAEVKAKLRARLEAYQRQTHDPRITGDMAIFAETLKFVEGRKASGYADSEAHKAKATKIGSKTK